MQNHSPASGTASFVRSVPYFASLSADEMQRIERETVELSFGKGEIIFLEGEPCKGLYVVKSGQVRLFKASPSGREQVLSIAVPGTTFNDAPVFDGGPNPVSASARTPSAVYLIPKEAVNRLLVGCPAANIIIKVLAGRLRNMARLVESLSLSSVQSRLGKLLLNIASTEGGASPAPSLTQEEMASMIGSVRDVVGRTLRALEKAGAIRIEGRRILIVNPRKLREIAEMSDKSRVRED